ncbi:adenylate cyclase type 10-like isoform X2 [Leptidea sinapis]|uniref:adenylate cyclase type 10-like isoform X2 n=1 Tax=Leptidea sinapis TaxID=189913 RepID=UPI0021C33451|nr:adenylate cyclase type 10-like isoform X2 [Leptidea sinapis]
MNFRRPRTRSRRSSLSYSASSHKWRNVSKKVSCKDDDLNEDDEEPKAGELNDWVEEFFLHKKACTTKSEEDVEVKLSKKQTLILSTLVPDELLFMDTFDKSNVKRFVGVLLMADVSGYTALSEKYTNSGEGGTYRLTVTLNTYLGSLIEVIYSHGGDIIKFAGDAFLALWKTDKKTFINHTIHTAIACALIIQHSFGSYETDVKVNLKVKLAISAGNLFFAPIGSGIDMTYIIIGLPVLEAKAAESACASGEVKLTSTAWGHCYSRNYDHVVDDNGLVTIKSILYDPRERDVTKPFLGFGAMVRQMKKTFISIESLPDILYTSPNELSNADICKRNEILSLRKTILLADEKDVGSEIRKFMIRPILTQIDAHQPLKYLTEMRQVSILFITLKPRECSYAQLITIVNNAYQITCEIVYRSMGCVNKIILFDKDVMILVIFGLRGFKHESEAQAALKCACGIKKSVSALDGVLEVSIGITTGPVYCGVVGHPLRREFTVIGAVVNKAARLMCGFRNKITCDETTFIKSKMSSNGFTLQPATELKGIVNPGRIFEYTEDIRVKEMYDIPVIQPLLDRDDEFNYFQKWIKDFNSPIRDFDALLLIGESRFGKTRLLEWMARYTRSIKLKVCYISLTSIHAATQYLALSQIFDQILDVKNPAGGFEKEEKIVNLVKHYSDELCYLNNVIKVRFAYPEGMYVDGEDIQREKAKEVFKKVLTAIPVTCIIFLDDLQNLDVASWDFLLLMLDMKKIYTVLTVTRGPLNYKWIAPLACQILDVEAVPHDLCIALRTKCQGMPGLIESFIIHLFSSGALEFKQINKDELKNLNEENLQFPESSVLRPIALNVEDQPKLDLLIQENENTDTAGDIKVCIVTRKQELNAEFNVQNLDALIMIQIDSLTPYQQLLLKISSVIGNVLSRDLLESIMYENDPITTAKAIKRLFSMRIFSCANIRYKNYNRKLGSNVSIKSDISFQAAITCECCFDHDPELNENLPKYAFCKVMRFRGKNARKTCYELLPLNQKKEFHSRIVNYLENNKQKCPDCGGTIMIIQSSMNFYPEIPFCNPKRVLELQTHIEHDDSDSPNENEFEIVPITQHAKNNSIYDIESSTSKSTIEDHKSDQSLRPSKVSILKVPVDDEICNDEQNKRRSTKRVTMSKVVIENHSNDTIEGHAFFDMFRAIAEANKLSDWHDLGILDTQDTLEDTAVDNHKRSFHIKIEKSVSKIDFKKCTCTELNIVIYEQLVHHAEEAELKIKVIEFLIKLSSLNILANNCEAAITNLENAENKINNDILMGIYTKFDIKKYTGKILSLKAAAYLMGGKHMAAKTQIERAANMYQINLKKVNDIKLNFSKIINFVKSKHSKYKRQYNILKSDSIFCLNIATLLYSTIDDEKTSRIAAQHALNLVKRYECPVIDLCDAFTNAIQIELDDGKADNTLHIERCAINVLRNLSKPIQADEVYAIGKIFFATFHARLARGELPAAIRSGFRSLVVSKFLCAENISLDIIPDLFYLLLCRRRVTEAIDVMKFLLDLHHAQNVSECETWYYALSIDMILDCGFQLESPQDINRYTDFALRKGKAGGQSRRRLVVGLWTYWLRAEQERKAKRLEVEALSWCNAEDDNGSLKTIISALRLAEGMLQSLAGKLDDLKKVVDLMELRSLADKELTRLEQDVKIVRAITPRWYLLKSKSLSLSGRYTYAAVANNQALEESRKTRNDLEEELARAATGNSQFWISSAKTGRFLHWRGALEHVRTNWHPLMYRINTSRQ